MQNSVKPEFCGIHRKKRFVEEDGLPGQARQ